MTDSSVSPIMVMGCTNKDITYRKVGHQTVCLQSPNHGVQQLVDFDASKGDVVGLNRILEPTSAQADLSDIAKYITAQTTSAGTMLYFDATGTGRTGTPIAMLQGVSTTVAALVSDGGVGYVPIPFTAWQQFGTPFTFRPAGLETLRLDMPAPGVPSQINGFDPSKSDKLDVSRVLNRTTANPDLSNVGNYLHATVTNGDTVLSVDASGAGGAGSAFAVLKGETTTIASLVEHGALIFTPTPISMNVQPKTAFEFRPEGEEAAVFGKTVWKSGPTHLDGFSPTTDTLDVRSLLSNNGIHATASTIGNFVSATESGGNETLWLDTTGHSLHTSAFAVLDHTNLPFAAIAGAMHIA